MLIPACQTLPEQVARKQSMDLGSTKNPKMLEIHLSNKRRPQDMLLIMRRKEEALDCRLAELTRDYIRCQQEIDFSLKKKTDANLKGHNIEKRLADTELKALYRQISDLRCAISCATKARAFFSLARLKLERHSGAKRKTAWNNMKRFLDLDQIKKMILRADVSVEQFLRKIDTALDRAIEGQKTEDVLADEEPALADEELAILEAMAERPKDGENKLKSPPFPGESNTADPACGPPAHDQQRKSPSFDVPSLGLSAPRAY